MSRIAQAFERAAAEKRPALITYLCAGDPDLASTPDLIVAIAEAGADVIELGVPFSDPTADGPVIQRASERALRAGATVSGVLDAVRAARARTSVPILLFGYYNPLAARGEAKVVREAKDAGADGFLVVDLPPEEAPPLRDHVVALGLDWVPLVAPTSTPARVARAAEVATSFVYVISVAGVTGAGHADLEVAAKRAADVRTATGRKVALGFGIKTADDARRAAPHVDGIVVGSALVTAIAEGGVASASQLVRSLRGALG
ncbi:tryptophan synthase subunit alpha [Sandaracinus amylolyticus]|uniref:tryptophan synthase subunit alpha n=1 Tax=Sandaracinus amylolyticus TaxID=927083 RepID=UPI001F016EAD|nr:tryptophan synthase subunit alpha [Sandaracinus amylolyticus]UJR78825.1 Tryptophan synthase subunit alpha [Sandaracinus amylolyticus]